MIQSDYSIGGYLSHINGSFGVQSFIRNLDMNYSGELYFQDDEPIAVDSFIRRSDSEIAFAITATWDGGKWCRTGIASLLGHDYVSNVGPSTHSITGDKGPDCTIKFSVTDYGDYLGIHGNWTESGATYFFSGELEPNL